MTTKSQARRIEAQPESREVAVAREYLRSATKRFFGFLAACVDHDWSGKEADVLNQFDPTWGAEVLVDIRDPWLPVATSRPDSDGWCWALWRQGRYGHLSDRDDVEIARYVNGFWEGPQGNCVANPDYWQPIEKPQPRGREGEA